MDVGLKNGYQQVIIVFTGLMATTVHTGSRNLAAENEMKMISMKLRKFGSE